MGDTRSAFHIRPLRAEERPWITQALTTHFGSARMVRRGALVDADAPPGLVAVEDAGGERLGLATYQIEGGACEVVALLSLRARSGVGTALLDSVRRVARQSGCHHLWVVTTNDNTTALRVYQKWGYRLTALRPGAVDEARRTLKPEIPLTGLDGIPLRDELELALDL